MQLFKWKNEYSVSVEELDKHHQELINLINKMYKNYNNADYIGQCIDDLLTLSGDHISAEEQYMKDKEFYGLDHHFRKHEAFLERIAVIELIYKANDLTVLKERIVQLGDWLLHHFMEEDKQYVKYL